MGRLHAKKQEAVPATLAKGHTNRESCYGGNQDQSQSTKAGFENKTKQFAVTSRDWRLCLREHKSSPPRSDYYSAFLPPNLVVKGHSVVNCGRRSVTANVSNRGLDIICSSSDD